MPSRYEGDVPEIGPWSVAKNEIIEKYARSFQTILNAPNQRGWCTGTYYIDAFAGFPSNKNRETQELVPGSAARSLRVTPRFTEHHFIDILGARVAALEELSRDRDDVVVHHGDGNLILRDQLLPLIQQDRGRRGLILIDPYGLDMDWETVYALGQSRVVDVIINLPAMGISRNLLVKNVARLHPSIAANATTMWGDESWREVIHAESPQLGLWDGPQTERVANSLDLAKAYCRRLERVAGFAHVTRPFPSFRPGGGGALYYLLLASPKPAASKIFTEIAEKQVRYERWDIT